MWAVATAAGLRLTRKVGGQAVRRAAHGQDPRSHLRVLWRPLLLEGAESALGPAPSLSRAPHKDGDSGDKAATGQCSVWPQGTAGNKQRPQR